MKASIRNKYQEFIDYIEFPTLIYVYETGKIIAINLFAKNILGEDCVNMNSLWEEKTRLKFSKKILNSGSEILYRKCIDVNNKKQFIDIEVNSIIIGNKHFIFCFFELSENQVFIKNFTNQLPRILWKNTNLIFKGANNCCRNDINYKDDMVSIYTNESNFDIETYHKMTEDDNEVIATSDNKYNVIQVLKVAKKYDLFVKIHRMPIIDRNEKILGIINVYKLILSREENQRIINSAVKENTILNDIIHRSDHIIILWVKNEEWMLEYITPNISKYGYNPEEFYEKKIKFKDIIHPEDYDKVHQEFMNHENLLNANGEVIVFESRIITADGKTVWTKVESKVMVKENKTYYLESVLKNITTSKVMKNEIQASKKAFQNKLYDLIYNNYNLDQFDIWDLINEDNIMTMQDNVYALSGGWGFVINHEGNLLTEPTITEKIRDEALALLNRKESKAYYKLISEQCKETEETVKLNFYCDGIQITGIPFIIASTYFATLITIAVIKPLKDSYQELEDQGLTCFLNVPVIKPYLYENLNEFLWCHIKQICNASYQRLELLKEKSNLEGSIEKVKVLSRKNKLIDNISQLIKMNKLDEDIFEKIFNEFSNLLLFQRIILCNEQNDYRRYLNIYDWNDMSETFYCKKNEKLDEKSIQNIIESLGNKDYIVLQKNDIDCKEIFTNTYATTFLIYRLKNKDKTSGFIAFGDMNEHRFSNDVINLLQDLVYITDQIINKIKTSKELCDSYSTLEKVLNYVDNFVYVISEKDDTIVYINDRVKSIYSSNILGQVYHEIFIEDGVVEKNNEMIEQVNLYQNYMKHVDVYDRIHDKFFIAHYNKAKWIDNQNVTVVYMYDITNIKRFNKKIQKQSEYDYLTGLPNRVKFEVDAVNLIKAAVSKQEIGFFILIDLDNFNKVNDGLGRETGDELLKNIARYLENLPTLYGKCYKFKGDEFLLVVDGENAYNHQKIINELLEEFRKTWRAKDNEYYCTMSMGISIFPIQSTNPIELIQYAQMALYESKKNGKNKYTYYKQQIEDNSHTQYERYLRKAINNKCSEFEVYYQPIYSKCENKIIGAEAIISWNSKELGIVKQEDFIPLSEYLGLIDPLEEFLLREACLVCKKWNEEGYDDFKMHIDLSLVLIKQINIVNRILEIVNHTGVNINNIVFEIKENVSTESIHLMQHVLYELHEKGFHLALDHFGTGSSSLNYLIKMPFHYIKTDKSLIENIGLKKYNYGILSSIIEFVHNVDRLIMIDGIDTKQQLESILPLPIEHYQGNYLSKPHLEIDFYKRYLSGEINDKDD